MMQLSLLESIKDKASKLLPTPYMELVEECTAPNLPLPTYEHVMLLCDSANTKPDAVDDIIRAIRRRIGDESVAVRHLTVLLLDALIRHCGPALHVEVASQKGLLRDLESIAIVPPTSSRGMQAKEAARTLILNLSIWFAGHPDIRCFILTTLANDVRTAVGPNAFEGTTPDVNARIALSNAPPARLGPMEGRADAFRTPGLGPQDRAGRPSPPRITVTAIPINLPTDELVATMLETCVTLNEYIANVERRPDGTAELDDVIVGFRDKVQNDHAYVAMLLMSNLDVNRDLLRSISDSQSAALQSIAELQSQPHDTAGAATSSSGQGAAPTTAASEATRPAVDAAVPAEAHVTAAAATTSPQKATPVAAKPVPPPPSVDDIFGPPAPQPPQSPSPTGGNDTTHVAATDTACAPPAAVTTTSGTATVTPSPASGAVEAKDTASAPEESRQAEVKKAAEQTTVSTVTPPSTEAPAATAAAQPPAGGEDDDFDSFLANHLSK